MINIISLTLLNVLLKLIQFINFSACNISLIWSKILDTPSKFDNFEKFSNKDYENAIKRNDKKKLISLFINDECNEMESCIKIVKYKILMYSIELYNYFYDKNKIQLNHYNNCIECIKKILNNNALSFEDIFSEEHMLLLKNSNERVKGISDITRLIINLAIEKHCIIKDENNNESSKSYDIPKIIYIINMAIKVNDIIIVKYLLEEWDNESKIDINCKDMYGNYLISYSINSEEIFKYLLEKGININKEYQKKLISLIISYKPSLLNTLLLQENVPINEKYGKEDYPLINAIKSEQFDSVISLVTYGKEHEYDMNLEDVDGNGALITSYNLKNEDNEKIFKYLINNLDINKKDSNGYTLLYHILMKQDIKPFKLLLDRIHFDNIDKNNNSIFHILINENLDIMLNYIFNEINQNNNSLIIKVNEIINNLYLNGETCISILIRSNNFSIKEIKEYLTKLKNLGADINKMDKQKNTTIEYLIDNKKYDIFNILIENGAIIDEFMIEKIFNTNDIIFTKIIMNTDVGMNLLKETIMDAKNDATDIDNISVRSFSNSITTDENNSDSL